MSANCSRVTSGQRQWEGASPVSRCIHGKVAVQGLSHVEEHLNVYQAGIAFLLSRKLLYGLLVVYCSLLSGAQDVCLHNLWPTVQK